MMCPKEFWAKLSNGLLFELRGILTGWQAISFYNLQKRPGVEPYLFLAKQEIFTTDVGYVVQVHKPYTSMPDNCMPDDILRAMLQHI